MSRKGIGRVLNESNGQNYNNGYEQGLAEGIALTGQGLAAVLKEETDRKNITEEKGGRDQKAVGTLYCESAGKGKREGTERRGRR